jgi:hypothetical protein
VNGIEIEIVTGIGSEKEKETGIGVKEMRFADGDPPPEEGDLLNEISVSVTPPRLVLMPRNPGEDQGTVVPLPPVRPRQTRPLACRHLREALSRGAEGEAVEVTGKAGAGGEGSTKIVMIPEVALRTAALVVIEKTKIGWIDMEIVNVRTAIYETASPTDQNWTGPPHHMSHRRSQGMCHLPH